MRAIRIREFGSPEVMKVEEVERPVPASGEILVKTYSSGINPADWKMRSSSEFADMHHLKLPIIPGWDASGVVEETGRGVTCFKKGDAVYGIPNFPGDGSYAEYLVGKASQFALKPFGISFNEAAGVPLAGLTAWTGIFKHGQLQPRQRILINGASGGVGSFAVQFAKWKGAYVIGTASVGNHDFLKQLDADEVIDYRSQQFDELFHDIDVVFDVSPTLGHDTRLRGVKVLKEGGILVSAHANIPFADDVKEALAKKNAQGEIASAQFKQEWLQQMAQLIDEGHVRVNIDKVYPLEQAAEAHRQSEQGHTRGKLVLEIRKEE